MNQNYSYILVMKNGAGRDVTISGTVRVTNNDLVAAARDAQLDAFRNIMARHSDACGGPYTIERFTLERRP